MYFNISSYGVELRDHFLGHGFHWTGESHNVDMISLEQVLRSCLHPEEGCGGPVGLHMTIRWPAEAHLEVQQWLNDSDPDEPFPEHFQLPLEFEVALPPLENPPDLLATWMELLERFEGTPLRVDVSGSDHIESPTEPPRREMVITATSHIPLRHLFAEDDDLGDQEHLTCNMITSLHDLCTSILENVDQWGPTEPTT